MFATLAIVALGLPACPEGGSKPAVKRECSKAFEQCQLEPGLLGVCGEAPCTADQTPPCLRCMSQH